MSVEEQDQIRGRLMRESESARRALAFLAIRATEWAGLLSQAGRGLSAMPGSLDACGTARRAIEGLPDKESLLSLVGEYEEQAAALETLERQLDSFRGIIR
jgi:hypothetical protein